MRQLYFFYKYLRRIREENTSQLGTIKVTFHFPPCVVDSLITLLHEALDKTGILPAGESPNGEWHKAENFIGRGSLIS